MCRVPPGSKLLDRERLLPQKRIQAPDTRGGEIKILDSCSRSQIHLWSKSQILRLLALAERLGPKVNPVPPYVDRLGLPPRSAVSCNIPSLDGSSRSDGEGGFCPIKFLNFCSSF
jgi:hypothetical protein